jgi:hypothetical protein
MSSDRPPPHTGVFPLSSKRASILLLSASLVLVPLAMYLLNPPWPSTRHEREAAPHLVLLATTWIFAVPLPYWGYLRSVVLGRLAAFLAFVLAFTISVLVARHIFRVTWRRDQDWMVADFERIFVPGVVALLGLLAVLASKTYRSLAAPRVETLGSLSMCAGTALVILWGLYYDVQGSTLLRAVLVAAALLIGGGLVHVTQRLRWLRRVVEGKVPGARAVPISGTPSEAGQGALPSVHDPAVPGRETRYFTLVRVDEGDYRTQGEREVATFYMPLSFDWLVIGVIDVLTMAGTFVVTEVTMLVIEIVCRFAQPR